MTNSGTVLNTHKLPGESLPVPTFITTMFGLLHRGKEASDLVLLERRQANFRLASLLRTLIDGESTARRIHAVCASVAS